MHRQKFPNNKKKKNKTTITQDMLIPEEISGVSSVVVVLFASCNLYIEFKKMYMFLLIMSIQFV